MLDKTDTLEEEEVEEEEEEDEEEEEEAEEEEEEGDLGLCTVQRGGFLIAEVESAPCLIKVPFCRGNFIILP